MVASLPSATSPKSTVAGRMSSIPPSCRTFDPPAPPHATTPVNAQHAAHERIATPTPAGGHYTLRAKERADEQASGLRLQAPGSRQVGNGVHTMECPNPTGYKRSE